MRLPIFRSRTLIIYYTKNQGTNHCRLHTNTFPLALGLRYIDDTFIVHKNELTKEIEESGKIPFLDSLIRDEGNKTTSNSKIYKKATHTD